MSLALLVVAAADYGYQWWRTHRDLMMTKEEVKEEAKNSEGNSADQGRAPPTSRRPQSQAMLAEVPKADVVVTNPTHIAVALRYDRKTMRAPKIVAKGIRLNAVQHPRNRPPTPGAAWSRTNPWRACSSSMAGWVARFLLNLFAAVAEVLAWVYRVNRYRYYAEMNQA